MDDNIQKILRESLPERLKEISDPPNHLYLRGEYPDQENKFLCVVGSRKYSSYGKDACREIISGLVGYPIVIVSGLAIGIDSIAHKTALDFGLKTVAVPGSGLNKDALYPAMHRGLAEQIVTSGGALISEFEPDFKSALWGFPRRNRIMVGLCDAVLVIEAEKKSGTLITARLALDYNRDVFVIPGSIFSKSSEGINYLMKNGATPVASADDVLEALGLKEPLENRTLFEDLTNKEKEVLEYLKTPLTRDELLEKIKMPSSDFNVLLSTLELKNLIEEKMGKIILK